MSQIDEEINRFSEYFRDQIRFIENSNDSLYTRILWVTLLDALSQAAHPSLGRKNHQRIVKFLEYPANWDIRDRCSLPQVKLNLEHRKLTHGKLYAFTELELSKWSIGSTYEPEHEPEISTLTGLAYCDCERGVINLCRYKELFYSYRNWLVHGFKVPGYGMDLTSNRKKAYYHSLDSRGKITWELVFPPLLFQRLVSTGFDELQKQLRN